jgi:hypothetical protein
MSSLPHFILPYLVPPPKRQKKSKKPSPKNWFEKCTVEELKQLCKAAVLPVSGTKPVLVDRLLTTDLTKRFAYEYARERFSWKDWENDFGYFSGSEEPLMAVNNHRKEKTYKGARRPDGVATQSLKNECREKGLVVSGKRFDFVLRLLQYETSAQTGVEPKKALGSTFNPETGKFQPKQRAKSMKLPDPAKLSERMRRKAYPPEEVKDKWSNDTSKYHCSRCVDLTVDIIQKEIIDKNLFERGEEKLAWQVVIDLIRWWIYPNGDSTRGTNLFEHVRGMGRCSSELKYELYPKLIDFLKKTTTTTTTTNAMNNLEEWGVGQLLRDLHKHARSYSVDDASFGQAVKKYVPEPTEGC